jgi:hypothetical protein
MSKFTVLFLMFIALSAQAQDASKKVIKCEFTFLLANEDVFSVPAAMIEANLETPVIPSYEKWVGEWTQKVTFGKNKQYEFTMKSFVSLQAHGSLWFSEPKYTTTLDKEGRVVSAFREHTDRVVRDYQLEEIKNDKPTLRLAIPITHGLNTVYNNPELSAIAASKGPELAFTAGIRKGLIEPDIVREMGVLCYLP